MTWTNERVEQLKKLWIEGLSASQIASQLGGVTRNAVIGKIHRLGLSGRKTANPRQAQPTKPGAKPVASAPRAPRQARRTCDTSNGRALAPSPSPEAEVEEEVRTENIIQMSRYITMQELDNHTCRWPIGDPQSPEFRFCGAPTDPGQIYCGPCAQKAYLPKGNHPKAPARMNPAVRRSQYR
ncbi:MAG: GcrA family cell cycle regulator [Pseudomonadota bacterium]